MDVQKEVVAVVARDFDSRGIADDEIDGSLFETTGTLVTLVSPKLAG